MMPKKVFFLFGNCVSQHEDFHGAAPAEVAPAGVALAVAPAELELGGRTAPVRSSQQD